jgi:hypothetical protein
MMNALAIALAIVAAMAWVLASRRREHRPVAVLLSFGLAGDLLVRALVVAIIAPLRDALGVDVPWTGWAWGAALLIHAIELMWPAALVATSLVVFARRKPWAAIIGWACAVATFAVVHPIAGDGSLARAFTAVQVLSVSTSVALCLMWLRRRTTPATSAQYALMMIVIAELVSLLGAWRVGLFDGWLISQGLYLLMLGIIALVQGRFLWNSPQSSQSSQPLA